MLLYADLEELTCGYEGSISWPEDGLIQVSHKKYLDTQLYFEACDISDEALM